MAMILNVALHVTYDGEDYHEDGERSMGRRNKVSILFSASSRTGLSGGSIFAGGPSWTIKLGRRGTTTASLSSANAQLTGFVDSHDTLISLFSAKGLSARDMVALSGSHTIEQAQCFTFCTRIFSNASDINACFATTRRHQCPASDGNSDLTPLDSVTPNSFDNNYFKNLIQKKCLLASDQVLFSRGSTDSIVDECSKNIAKLKYDFAPAIIKMGDISPLSVSQGQARKQCYVVK
ncbi:lignin-forming anionic peroxidase-like [Mangifera indica]|uniref:lignin-forming anionic peroxidase-like n=1 Tax=Mangifera indica TaxID=29780 RepID=UPI001CF9F3D9|nr:lignin-forming anionic peroxidase-like [Mangifera indica]